MKVFEKGNKVNFVDDNNVVVGYDTYQDCCEDAGWYIAEKIIPYDWDKTSTIPEYGDVEPYCFDNGFFERVESGLLDMGKMVAFKLTAEGIPDIYLHLYNCHNGYYSHGFTVENNGKKIMDDYL